MCVVVAHPVGTGRILFTRASVRLLCREGSLVSIVSKLIQSALLMIEIEEL